MVFPHIRGKQTLIHSQLQKKDWCNQQWIKLCVIAKSGFDPVCPYMLTCLSSFISLLRTFAPIATAHRHCARKFTRHVMHRARALRNKLNNDREDGHCYSSAWI